jgi:hypothetical protein
MEPEDRIQAEFKGEIRAPSSELGLWRLTCPLPKSTLDNLATFNIRELLFPLNV